MKNPNPEIQIPNRKSRIFIPIWVVSVLLAWAGGLAADELVLKNGQKMTGLISGTDGKSVRFDMTIGQGQAEVPYPLAQIDRIQFANDAALEALLQAGDPELLPQVLAVWEKRRPFLGLAGSDSGAWALRCARLQLAKKTKKAAAEAVDFCRLVETGDWDAERKSGATRLRLTALAASGKIDEALREAEGLQDLAGSDESALAAAKVKARFLQAELAWKRLLELEKNWPKWRLMPEKCRERAQYLNQALDGFLFPVVFHSDLVPGCAEGLLRTAEIEMHEGRPGRALAALEEVLRHFPDPEFRPRAEQMKKELEKKTPHPADKKS